MIGASGKAVNALRRYGRIAVGYLAKGAILATTLAAQPLSAYAQSESPIPATEPPPTTIEERPYLLGDLGRAELAEEGYRLDLIATHDFFANTTGGSQRGGGVVGNFNALLNIDTTKAGWWDNGEFSLWAIGVYGRRPSKVVGDYQWTNVFEGFDTVEPYQAYYQHSFLDGRIKVLAGIADFTLEYAVANYSFAFANSSFWTPSTITQIPYSFYPVTGLGARVLAKPTDDTYVLAGVYDARPTDFDRMRAVDLELSKSDGAYSIGEVGYESAGENTLYTKLGFGAWYSSGEFEDVMGQERTSNFGMYVVGQKELWRECDTEDQGLGMFFHVGTAKEDRNFNSIYAGGGVRYKGLIHDRDSDVIGAGYAYAEASDDYVTVAPETDSSEQAFELFYRIQIVPSVAVTPDIQYVINPGLNPEFDDAVVLYLRTEVLL